MSKSGNVIDNLSGFWWIVIRISLHFLKGCMVWLTFKNGTLLEGRERDFIHHFLAIRNLCSELQERYLQTVLFPVYLYLGLNLLLSASSLFESLQFRLWHALKNLNRWAVELFPDVPEIRWTIFLVPFRWWVVAEVHISRHALRVAFGSLNTFWKLLSCVPILGSRSMHRIRKL